MELTVADDGVGIKDQDVPKSPEKRGADYVAIFVRQLGGSIISSGAAEGGTMIRMRFPAIRTAKMSAVRDIARRRRPDPRSVWDVPEAIQYHARMQ